MYRNPLKCAGGGIVHSDKGRLSSLVLTPLAPGCWGRTEAEHLDTYRKLIREYETLWTHFHYFLPILFKMICFCERKRKLRECSLKIEQSGTTKKIVKYWSCLLFKGRHKHNSSKNSMEKAVCNWINSMLHFEGLLYWEVSNPKRLCFQVSACVYLGYWSHAWARPQISKFCPEFLVWGKTGGKTKLSLYWHEDFL